MDHFAFVVAVANEPVVLLVAVAHLEADGISRVVLRSVEGEIRGD